jgi:hypothetical protein
LPAGFSEQFHDRRMRTRGIRVPFEGVVIPPIEFRSILPGHQERPERRRLSVKRFGARPVLPVGQFV